MFRSGGASRTSHHHHNRWNSMTRRECCFQRGGRPMKALTSACLLFPVIVLALLYLDVHHWSEAARTTSTTYLRRSQEPLSDITWACEDQTEGISIGEMKMDQILVYQKPTSGGVTAKIKQFIMSLVSIYTAAFQSIHVFICLNISLRPFHHHITIN